MISVITATIPGRERFLEECKASVAAAAGFVDLEHLVMLDEHREGCSVMCNRLVEQAKGDWLFLLADDDLVLPHGLARLFEATDNADVVYSPPLVWGVHDPWWFFQAPPVIPATALIRKSMWLDLGGYDPAAKREEDRKLWTAAVDRGCRFVRVDDQPTWVYRLGHGGNKSFQ